MASKRLEQFRNARAVEIRTLDGHAYQACGIAATVQRRIDLRPGYDAQRIVNYNALVEVIHAGGIIVSLEFASPPLVVNIKGKNLQGMVDALREERVTFIQEHVAEWHSKAEKGAPFIESMEVHQRGKPRNAEEIDRPRKRH